MLRLTILFWCIAFADSTLAAAEVELKSVTFYPPKLSVGWVSIRPDDMESGPKKHVNPNVVGWKKGSGSASDESKPVAYVSEYKACVGALFVRGTAKCPLKTIYVKAQTPDMKYTLPHKVLTENCEYTKNEMNEAFLKYQVQAFPSFKLDWYYSTTPDDETSWTLIGTSKNELYVVHQAPVEGVIRGDGFEEVTTFYHSSIFISCLAAKGQGNKDGQSDPDAIVETIFQKFRDRCVTKAKGTKCMEYWGPDLPSDDKYISLYGLYQFENGRCGEWSGLLLDMLKLQGIKSANKLVAYYQEAQQPNYVGYLNNVTEITAKNAATAFFGDLFTDGTIKFLTNDDGKVNAYLFVKEHNFNLSPHAFFVNAPLDPNNIQTTQIGDKLLLPSDLTGVAAQGNSNPKSAFTNHAILMYKQKNGNTGYYDPSYGKPLSGTYGSLNDYETDAVAGFGAALRYVDPATQLGVQIIWLYENNTISQQLTFK